MAKAKKKRCLKEGTEKGGKGKKPGMKRGGCRGCRSALNTARKSSGGGKTSKFGGEQPAYQRGHKSSHRKRSSYISTEKSA